MKARLLAVLLVAAGAACGADREFDQLVKSIEQRFGVKRTHVPLMGVANFLVKVARPGGASGFKLAIFEDFHATLGARDQAALDRFMEEARGDGMHSLVVTHSRRDGEASYILAGEIGKTTKLLIATFERNEATVVEVQVNVEALLKTINSPGEAHREYGGER